MRIVILLNSVSIDYLGLQHSTEICKPVQKVCITYTYCCLCAFSCSGLWIHDGEVRSDDLYFEFSPDTHTEVEGLGPISRDSDE